MREEQSDKITLPGIFFRGCAMGAADVVPGVSGGTIAFISGIYERLLTAISDAPIVLLALFRHRNIVRFWRELDGTFLVTLLAGIATSVLLLAGIITAWLEHEPVRLWSFFFGLVLAAIWHVGRQIERYTSGVWVALAIGTAVSLAITLLAPAQLPVTAWTLFGSGALAICAMILPGISGSFILLLLGMYGPVIGAIDERAFGLLGLFAAGCLAGLLGFTRLIAWGLQRFNAIALALLTGFMVGSLNKIWPWKVTLEWGVDRHGDPVPLVQENVGPLDYASVSGEPHDLLWVILLALLGLTVVLAMEWFAASRKSRADELPVTRSEG